MILKVGGMHTAGYDLLRRDRQRLWHPAAQMRTYAEDPPLIVERAEGGWLHTADGRRVYDGISSWWCKALGHRHPRLLARMQAQLERFEHHILAGATNEAAVGLIERWLVHANRPHAGWFSCGFYADNGSTGVEVALKMAVQWQAQQGRPGRSGLATLEGAYHGETIGALSLTDQPRYAAAFAPLLFPVHRLRGLPLRAGEHDPAWQDAAAEWPALAAQLDPLAGRLAAVVVEPVMQGAAGIRFHSPDLIRRLRGWCDAHGVLLIADEIAAGCWRLGQPLACQHAGVLPDLAVLAKGFTAGAVPGSLVLARACISEGFDGTWDSGRAFLHSNTFAGNALAVAAGHALLDAVELDALAEGLPERARALRAHLDAIAARHAGVRGVRACGMAGAITLCRRDGSDEDPAQRRAWRTHRAALELGALLRPMGDSMYLMPPLNAGLDELAGLAGVLDRALAAVPCA